MIPVAAQNWQRTSATASLLPVATMLAAAILIQSTLIPVDADVSWLITVCERGYGKRTQLGDYPVKNRGVKGVITIKTTTRNGLVQGVRIVSEDDHLILISDRGKLIRIRAKDVPVQGRATQGVRVMRVDDGEHVAAIERLAEGEESDIAEGAPIEAIDDGDTVPNEDLEAEGEEDGGDEGEDESGDEGEDDAE